MFNWIRQWYKNQLQNQMAQDLAKVLETKDTDKARAHLFQMQEVIRVHVDSSYTSYVTVTMDDDHTAAREVAQHLVTIHHRPTSPLLDSIKFYS